MDNLEILSKQIDDLIEIVDNADRNNSIAIIVNEDSYILEESSSINPGWNNAVRTCFYLEILFCVNVLFCAVIYRATAAVL
jgi:hypothetical protein